MDPVCPIDVLVVEPPSQPRTKILAIPGRWALVIWSHLLLLIIPAFFRVSELFFPLNYPIAVQCILEVFVASILLFALRAHQEMIKKLYRAVMLMSILNAFGQLWHFIQILSIFNMIEFSHLSARVKAILFRYKTAQIVFLLGGLLLIFVTLDVMLIALADLENRNAKTEDDDEEKHKNERFMHFDMDI